MWVTGLEVAICASFRLVEGFMDKVIHIFFHPKEYSMNAETKLVWLKRILMFKVLVVALLWGLPTLLAPASVLKLFGVELPADPFYLRMFGGVMLGLVFLYWFAYQDPVKNRDMIRYAVVDNSLSFLTILGVGLTTGISNPTVWVSAVLVLFFAIAFWYLMPPKQTV
jgi:hypothetical protein